MQSSNLQVRTHCLAYVSFSGVSCSFNSCAVPSEAPLVTPVSDQDVRDKQQMNEGAATAGTDVEQENRDLKREVSLHYNVIVVYH